MMNPLLESIITGVLVGAIVLGVYGMWLGIAVMILTAWWSSWVSWGDILRISITFGAKGAGIGFLSGLFIGIFTNDVFHLLIGAATGALCAIYWGVNLAFSDTSARSVQINRAIAN